MRRSGVRLPKAAPLFPQVRALRLFLCALGSVDPAHSSKRCFAWSLSFREFRAGLAAALRRVQEPGAEPVFVGAHRRAEAVVMSVERYEQLVAAAGRREAVGEALASVGGGGAAAECGGPGSP